MAVGGALRQGRLVERRFDARDLVQQAGIGAGGEFLGGAGNMGPDVPLHAGNRCGAFHCQRNGFLAPVGIGHGRFRKPHFDEPDKAARHGRLADTQGRDGFGHCQGAVTVERCQQGEMAWLGDETVLFENLRRIGLHPFCQAFQAAAEGQVSEVFENVRHDALRNIYNTLFKLRFLSIWPEGICGRQRKGLSSGRHVPYIETVFGLWR